MKKLIFIFVELLIRLCKITVAKNWVQIVLISISINQSAMGAPNLNGAYYSLKQELRYLSPLWGGVLHVSGIVNNMYNSQDLPESTRSLISNNSYGLFKKVANFPKLNIADGRHGVSKALTGDKSLYADLIYFTDNAESISADAIKSLIQKFIDHDCDPKLIKSFLNAIKESVKFEKDKLTEEYTTIKVILCHLYMQAEESNDALIKYADRLKQLYPELKEFNINKPLSSEDKLDDNNVEHLFFSYIQSNYIPTVPGKNWKCVEFAILNLINALLYNKE